MRNQIEEPAVLSERRSPVTLATKLDIDGNAPRDAVYHTGGIYHHIVPKSALPVMVNSHTVAYAVPREADETNIFTSA